VAELWCIVFLDEDQLETRRFWYDSMNDTLRAQWVGAAIALARK